MPEVFTIGSSEEWLGGSEGHTRKCEMAKIANNNLVEYYNQWRERIENELKLVLGEPPYQFDFDETFPPPVIRQCLSENYKKSGWAVEFRPVRKSWWPAEQNTRVFMS